MRRWLFSIAAAFIVCLGSFGLVLAQNSPGEIKYTLGPGDVVDIRIDKHPVFGGIYTVNPQGKIEYDEVGEVDAAGMTKEELQKKIKDMVKRYIPNAVVHVSIKRFESKEFYVLGEVGVPGRYHMSGGSTTVKDALESAGMPTSKAALNEVKIMTDNKTLKKEEVKADTPLKPGETLYVPPAKKKDDVVPPAATPAPMPDIPSVVDSSKYTLGPEDIIDITVGNHPEFSGVYTVNMEGKIPYKIAGEIDVTGLTRAQLQQKVQKLVSAYVVSPQVTVSIVEYKSKLFFVLGEVAKPGQYHMRSQNISVKDAIVMADMPTPKASMRNAKIITPGRTGSTSKEVNLYAIFYNGDMKENVMLQPNDTLYVPAVVKETSEKKKVTDTNFDALKYTLGPEDVVDITVNNHPDLSGTYPISQEGKLQYKYVGDIDVVGMTRGQLEDKIKTVISPYVEDPQVSVSITEFKSKVIFVLGEVKKPGKYRMRSESISVKDAIIMAGLPVKGAALNKARVITSSENGMGTSQEINLDALLYQGDLSQNIFMHSGDSLYVPAEATSSSVENKKNNSNFAALKYTLGPEDVVEITVMNRPDFSGTYPISLEGKIQYRFVGDIDVRGMTKEQLEAKIKTVVAPYVTNPEVNVNITEFRSKVFYVVGEVGNPGKYYMRSEDITVNEAIMMAGLPTTSAAMRKAKIITPGINGTTTRKVNLYSLLYMGDLRENLLLKPGDYLYVPATVMAKVIRIVNPVSTTVGLATGPAADTGSARDGIRAATARP